MSMEEKLEHFTAKSNSLIEKNLDLEKSNKYGIAFSVIFAAMFVVLVALILYKFRLNKYRMKSLNTNNSVSYLVPENNLVPENKLDSVVDLKG